jgi:hypothetical protein
MKPVKMPRFVSLMSALLIFCLLVSPLPQAIPALASATNLPQLHRPKSKKSP